MASKNVSDYLATDDLTILLGLIAATVFLLQTFNKPQPLVHPILLGRQSDVARVRNPSESAVYRNYGTGLISRFPLRPGKDVHILADFVRSDQDLPRTLWGTKISNSALQDRVAAAGTGLIRLAGLQPGESNVLLFLNDCIEFLISDLALASHSIPSFTLTASNLLSQVLESHPPSTIITNGELLPSLLELIYDGGHNTQKYTIVVVGEPSARAMASVASKIKVLRWEDVEREGNKVEKILSPIPKPQDVFTVSFYDNGNGLQGAQFSHANLTAGVAAINSMFPAAQALSRLDTIVSGHSLSTAYGRAIAYSAIYEGTSFATLASSKLFHVDEATVKHDIADLLSIKKFPIPSPTILFIKPGHLEQLVDAILREAKKSFILNTFAWRHKLAGISEGFVTKDSLWDRLVYDGARARVIGEGAGTVRAVVVGEGPLPATVLTPARVALSCPIINTYTHPLVPAPVLASHPLDLQAFPTSNEKEPAASGPPSVNVEAKVVGVSDEVIEAGGDPEGLLLIRGPPVGRQGGVEESYVDVRKLEDDGWVATGARARIQTNGAFKLLL
ncbi:hypothetical protein D9758_003190 [Tetrapyrgos nigripes]|uniref:AMP-dependent synthetase/ligase domain-containing protein n=1 Tax=Tetrapyrgos nigripes TaxID=182062 RepID=A0A8H5LPV4_9AGAR|nr:hypothetical protein D9758_003190 [Tetrapyrgos nigripes]